jgi:hypothetical protein
MRGRSTQDQQQQQNTIGITVYSYRLGRYFSTHGISESGVSVKGPWTTARAVGGTGSTPAACVVACSPSSSSSILTTSSASTAVMILANEILQSRDVVAVSVCSQGPQHQRQRDDGTKVSHNKRFKGFPHWMM